MRSRALRLNALARLAWRLQRSPCFARRGRIGSRLLGRHDLLLKTSGRFRALAAWALAISASACAPTTPPPPAEVLAPAAATQVTPPAVDELAVLEATSQAVCPELESSPFGTPRIAVDESAFVLECVFAAGHAMSVRIERYDSPGAALTAFEAEVQGKPVQEFHAQPSAEWEEPFLSGELQGSNRAFLWQMDRWTVRVISSDDTACRIAPDPREVAEIVYANSR